MRSRRPGERNFLFDMSLIGDALLACVAAVRVNYAMFGNADRNESARAVSERSVSGAEQVMPVQR
jgi:hypothetical protein